MAEFHLTTHWGLPSFVFVSILHCKCAPIRMHSSCKGNFQDNISSTASSSCLTGRRQRKPTSGATRGQEVLTPKNVYFCHRLCLRSPHEHSVIENIKFLFLKNFWIFSEDLTKDLVSLDIYQIQTGYRPSFFYGFTICEPFVVFQMSCNSGRICILVASCTFQNDKSYL